MTTTAGSVVLSATKGAIARTAIPAAPTKTSPSSACEVFSCPLRQALGLSAAKGISAELVRELLRQLISSF